MRCIELGMRRNVLSFLGAVLVSLAASGWIQSTAKAEQAVVPASATSSSNEKDIAALATPTHHQTGLIKANVAGLPNRKLTCFCVLPDNRIVAGCAGGKGELRVFDEAGEFVETWSAPFEPEAIYARADGKIFLAGEGQLARLSPMGELELQQSAPHVESMSGNLEKVRKDVIEQQKQRAEMFVQQSEQYDKLIDQATTQVDDLKKQIADLGDDADDAGQKQRLEQQLAVQEQMKQQYGDVKKQWDEMVAQQKPKELTDAEIDKLVEQSVNAKRQASSISATDDQVFVATRAVVGYGFAVWKTDGDFAGGEQIISGLSGCCGQMDVKANDDGLFVAENSKHRVCRYDQDGKVICNWGRGARSGIEGFGSCCNPMNVAFGPEGAIYTAEDNTGRIKRYSPDGELLGLVGSVDLVPGCKNCSIAVSDDGDRVFMLDITRGHIVRMDRYKPGETPAPQKYEEDAVQEAVFLQPQSSEPPNVGGAVAKGLLKVLGYGD